MAREKEIFRDCYNMLLENLQELNLTNISLKIDELVHHKYKDSKVDQALCVSLCGVIVDHLLRKDDTNEKQ